MAPAILSMIAFLALMAWRFVFVGSRCRRFVRAIALRQHRSNSVSRQGLRILDPVGAAVIADSSFEDSSDGLCPLGRKDRAQKYLGRIVALTGATQMGDAYFLDVGKTRFHVDYRRVRRVRDFTDPSCAYEETCFYSAYKGMPKAEEIATALLQLRNNPALFDRWAVQNGQAIKADGQMFSRA